MDYKKYRIDKGIAAADVVELIHGYYPKFSKATLSMAENPSRYGVKLVPHAEELLVGHFGACPAGGSTTRSKPFRRKPCRLVVYLPTDLRAEVKQLMETENIDTAQELLEMLVREWVERRNKPWNS